MESMIDIEIFQKFAMGIFWCLCILIFVYFAFCLKNYIRTVFLAFNLSGPPALPVLGNVLLLNNVNKLGEYANNASQLYGTIARCWISIIPFFFIYEPRHLKIILGGKNSKKNIFYKFLDNFFGDGLITRNGIKWSTHRALIQPYFRINMLEKFIDIFSENSEKLLEGLEEKDIEITPFINKCILGILHELGEYANNASQLYGTIARCWISIIPFFFIYEPRHLKIILGGKNSKKNIFYKFLDNFFGDGLITRNGIKWSTHRALIQPYFRINMLEKFIDIFSENSEKLLEGLEEKDIEITPFINKCILGILHEAVLGVRLEDDTESPYRKGEVLLNQRIIRPWLLLDTIFKRTPFGKTAEIQKITMHSYTEKILLERRGDLKKLHPESLLDMFIEIAENNIDFKDEDIINEAVTFMLAGHASVSTAVAFTLYYIAKYKDIQEKIVQELYEVYVDDKLRITDLYNLKYLEQCIKESLRLTPSIPIISRILTEDITLDGRTFPAGANIFISPFVTHRLPHHYPDPLRFDPERFSQENVDKRHPFAFIPFSMGQRNCIGYKFAMLEIKIILAKVLKRFHISLVPGHENLNMAYRTALRAVGGVWLHLTLRK